jgi:hypothetical protein
LAGASERHPSGRLVSVRPPRESISGATR